MLTIHSASSWWAEWQLFRYGSRHFCGLFFHLIDAVKLFNHLGLLGFTKTRNADISIWCIRIKVETTLATFDYEHMNLLSLKTISLLKNFIHNKCRGVNLGVISETGFKAL
jgi:hypothetical protein